MPEFVPLSVAFLIAILMCVVVYVFSGRQSGATSFAWRRTLRLRNMEDLTEKADHHRDDDLGGLAGMVAIGEVLGDRYRYYHDFSDGWGYLGIAVALLGRNHPLGIFIAAIFFAVLKRGQIFVDIETRFVSKDLVEVLQAIIIIFVASLGVL